MKIQIQFRFILVSLFIFYSSLTFAQSGYTLIDSCHVITPYIEGFNRTYLITTDSGTFQISDSRNLNDTNWNINSTSYYNFYNSYNVYDSLGRISAIIYMRDSLNIWINNNKSIFTYDNLGNVIDSMVQYYIGNAWVNMTKWDWLKDSSGNIVYYESWYWSNGQWNKQHREELFYDSLFRDTLEIFFNGNINQWDTVRCSRKNYDTFGNILMTEDLNFTNFIWVNSQQSLFTYDSLQRILFHIDQTYDGITWVNQLKDSIYYDTLGNVNQTYFSWDSSSWVCNYYDNKEYYSTNFYRETSGSCDSGCVLNYPSNIESFQYDSISRLIYHNVFDTLNLDRNIYHYFYNSSGFLFYEIDSTILHNNDVLVDWCFHYMPLLFSPEQQFYNLCSGDSIKIINHVSGGTGHYHYSLKYNNVILQDTLPVLNSIASNHFGIYSMTVSDDAGNYYTDNIFVEIHPDPVLGNDTIICKNTSITLNPGSFATYQWQDGSTTPTFSATSILPDTILYWVRVSDTTSCSNTDSITVIFDVCQSVNELNNHELKIFPDPVLHGEEIKIVADKSADLILITSITGQILFETRGRNISLISRDLKPGIYYVSFYYNDIVITKRLVVI